MLVATASIGLIAPMAAHASDVLNLDEMNDYASSKKSSSNRFFDSNTFVNDIDENTASLKESEHELDLYQNDFEAGSFSDTTTLDGKVIFTLGALNGNDDVSESTLATYMWQGNLNTSFTGDDNLYVRLKTETCIKVTLPHVCS